MTGVADAGAPFGGAKTIGTSLETTLRRWGVTDSKRQKDIRESIKRASERLLLTLMKHEEKMSAEERGGIGAQTEMIGEEGCCLPINVVKTHIQDSSEFSLKNSCIFLIIF